MPDQIARIDVVLFAVFLLCGWLIMLISPPNQAATMRPARRRLLIIGAPIFAAICVIVAVRSGPSDAASSGRDAEMVALLPLFVLAALGGIIAVPLALRYKFRGRHSNHASSLAQHIHEHHSHEHEHEHVHDHGSAAGHTHHAPIQVQPRGTFQRRRHEP